MAKTAHSKVKVLSASGCLPMEPVFEFITAYYPDFHVTKGGNSRTLACVTLLNSTFSVLGYL